MGIKITQKGNFEKTDAYLKKMKDGDIFAALDQYGAAGVAALSAATPVKTGLTSQSWSYDIEKSRGYWSIRWYNSHQNAGAHIAILLQYGHGTRQGGYVQGQDYIMPAIRPIFDQIEKAVEKVVRG